MSISSASSPFRKRANVLSFESSKFSLERSRSCVEPISGNRFKKSHTFGQVLSSEGLDLGLPGVYRAKSDDAQNITLEIDVCSVRTRKKVLHLDELKESVPCIEFSSGLHPYEEIYPNHTRTAVPCIGPDMTECMMQPPPKPPRVKSRRTGTSICTEINNPITITTSAEVLPASSPIVPHVSNFNSVMLKTVEFCKSPRSARNMRVEYEKKQYEDLDDVFLENEKKIEAKKFPPIYTTVKKFKRKSKEKLRNIRSDDSTVSPRKPDIFSRTFSDAGNYTSHQQLKASLSGPFDFRKVSSGEMLQTTPIDLLQSHVSSRPQETRNSHQKLPELPPRNFIKDDTCLGPFHVVQGPDILSHVNISKTKTLSCSSSELKKYEISVWNRSSKSSSSKKTSWFFRRLSNRKHSNNDSQTECLLNQVEPLDHGLLSRKDSHGSTEDESMENHQSILDVKDKKKKKKDKKGKPPSRHGSDAKQSDKVRNKLRKFISKRPTMESLQERGLIKETVFGCPLDKLCEKEGSAVPKFVKMCVEEVEERGLNIDGIYRVSGNLSHVQKLRYMVDRDMVVNLKDPEWEDIHVITGALKMFLRELSEPVIPFQFFDKFIATCKISDVNSRLDATKSLIKAMPKPNKETLKYLMRHFCNVVSHSDANRMQVQNVAIVFGPTLLLKPPEMTSHYDPGGGNMAVYMMYQNQIVDYMLTDYDTLFS